MQNTEVKKTPLIHVAVGVIRNVAGEVLIALRAAHRHQGNLWEFPGGKIEGGESCRDALTRELKEEIGIDVLKAEPLIQVEHHYSDKSVLLSVCCVTEFRGQAFGREGQPVKWVAPGDLHQYEFPAANRPILNAVTLPERMAITGDVHDERAFADDLEAAIGRGARMLLLRLKSRPYAQWQKYRDLAQMLYPTLPVVVNSAIGESYWAEFTGVHLTSEHLVMQATRPVPLSVVLGASCHNESEVRQANAIGADYITLSPVLSTFSHPETEPLGWSEFARLARIAQCPVYALGGLTEGHVVTARECGGQGIAAIGYYRN